MAGFTIISDVSEALVKLFKDNMVPDVIQSPDGVGLCSPAEKGDFALGIYLYDVKESEEVFSNGMQMSGINKQKFPSHFLDLYFMITPYSMSDLKFRMSEEQRIMGRVLQIMGDTPILDSSLLGSSAVGDTYPMRIELLRLSNEEKMKLWTFPNEPYKASLYYRVAPVEIESTRVRDVSRVRRVDVEFSEVKHGNN